MMPAKHTSDELQPGAHDQGDQKEKPEAQDQADGQESIPNESPNASSGFRNYFPHGIDRVLKLDDDACRADQ
jgi:hypothetical protein